MNLLTELNNFNYNLSDYQKAILLICHLTGTPLQAYDTTIGNMNLTQARDSLARLGYITFNTNAIQMTPVGQTALTEYNLIDDGNQLTPDGEEIAKLVPNEQLNPTSDPETY